MELIFSIVNEELARLLWQLALAHPYQAAAWALWVFFIGFVLYAGLQDAIKAQRWWLVVPASPFIILFGVIDLLSSPIFGLLFFHEILPYKWTISGRLTSHYYEASWKGERARHIGDRIDYILKYHINSRN